MALALSHCTSSQEPFFHFNSPFAKHRPAVYEIPGVFESVEDPGLAASPDYPDNQPIPLLPADDTGTPVLPDLSPVPVAAGGPGTPSVPEIQTHKRGPAGSTCYTCRGKGYVFLPVTEATGDNHPCPACGGDGIN